MAYYINFHFKNLVYDEKTIMGHFYVIPCDGDAECDFIYDRHSQAVTIYNGNKPDEEILPLPVNWLLDKLEEQGYLNENESRICY